MGRTFTSYVTTVNNNWAKLETHTMIQTEHNVVTEIKYKNI